MKRVVVSLLLPLVVASPLAADIGWSAATLYDGKWSLALRYDVAPLDKKGNFWVSMFASNSTDKIEQTAIGWGVTAKLKTETNVELGLSLGINANRLFTSQAVKGNLFVAVGMKF